MTTATSARQDIHRPAEFDPADYQVIDYLDVRKPDYYQGLPIEVYEKQVACWQARIFEHFPDWRTGGEDHRSISQCNHCGHPGLRWVAVVEHTSGAKLAFGEICAERCELPGRDAFKAKFIKDRAAREKAAAEAAAARAAFVESAPDVVEFLAGLNDDYDSREPEFLLSLKSQLSAKGELSERQVEAARKFLVKRQERTERIEAEKAALVGVAPLVEGKRQIEGEVLSTKWQESFYGGALKMLVREDDGNKVWGTVPSVLDGEGVKGKRVRFSATVERSEKDEHFGFFKRPTKAEVLS